MFPAAAATDKVKPREPQDPAASSANQEAICSWEFLGLLDKCLCGMAVGFHDCRDRKNDGLG